MDRCGAQNQRYLCRAAACVLTLGLSHPQRKSTRFSVRAAHTLTLTQSLPQLVLHYIASILELLPLCSSTNFIVS